MFGQTFSCRYVVYGLRDESAGYTSHIVRGPPGPRTRPRRHVIFDARHLQCQREFFMLVGQLFIEQVGQSTKQTTLDRIPVLREYNRHWMLLFEMLGKRNFVKERHFSFSSLDKFKHV